MSHYTGRVLELLLEAYQNAAARLYSPAGALPGPGQYLQAHRADDLLEAVPVSLFTAGECQEQASGEISFPISGPLPPTWQPGTELSLRGPLGRGFEPPRRFRRMALAALDGNPRRLLPLVPLALQQGAEVVLYCDQPVGELPLAVEVQSLKDLPKALAWADYLAADIALENIEELNEKLGIRQQMPGALIAQILIIVPMPCGGMAKCGVCTVATTKGPRLACEDGPVFELREILQ